MKKLIDLSNKAIEEYMELLGSDLFTPEQLDFWVFWVTDDDNVGLTQRKVVALTKRSESTLMKWRRAGVIKAQLDLEGCLYDAKNIIKIMKIEKVQKGKIQWKNDLKVVSPQKS